MESCEENHKKRKNEALVCVGPSQILSVGQKHSRKPLGGIAAS